MSLFKNITYTVFLSPSESFIHDYIAEETVKSVTVFLQKNPKILKALGEDVGTLNPFAGDFDYGQRIKKRYSLEKKKLFSYPKKKLKIKIYFYRCKIDTFQESSGNLTTQRKG